LLLQQQADFSHLYSTSDSMWLIRSVSLQKKSAHTPYIMLNIDMIRLTSRFMPGKLSWRYVCQKCKLMHCNCHLHLFVGLYFVKQCRIEVAKCPFEVRSTIHQVHDRH